MNPQQTSLHFSDDLVNHHLDAVLRASGSALRQYSMEKTIMEMREAMRRAMTAEPGDASEDSQ